jgi:tetratricopeptide (TPR) repeat protein
MDDALPKNETTDQTGEPNGQAGLPHAEAPKADAVSAEAVSADVSNVDAVNADLPKLEDSSGYDNKKRAPFTAMKILFAVLVVTIFAFASFGFGETQYTTRHWPTTIFSGGGLLPKLLSGSYAVALRAAGETLRGNYESTKGNSAESEKSYERALASYEALDAVNTVCGHFTLMGLSKAQAEQKHDAEARKTLLRSLESAKEVYGAEHETVAISLRELAFLTTREKNFAQAENYYKEALALDTKGLGPDHFDVAYDMSCVGEMLLLQKRYPEAIKYLSDSIARYKKARGEFHPSFLWVEESLGRAYYESQAYKESARQFEVVLAASDRLHGTPGKDYYRDLAWLGWSYFHDANPDRARIRARKLKEMLAKKSDSELSIMVDVMESNADLFMMLEDYDSAKTQFERVLSLQEKKYGQKAPQLRGVLLYLGQCYDKLGQADKAQEIYARASTLD